MTRFLPDRKWLAALPALTLVAAFVLLPGALLVRMSFYRSKSQGFFVPGSFTLDNFAALTDEHHRRIIGLTVMLGLAIASLSLVISYPLALFLRAQSPFAQKIGLLLVMAPKTAGLLAALFGLQRWLPRGLPAATFAEVYLIVPYATLVMFVQLSKMDRLLEDAARGLGANSWQVFRRVTLPLSAPGILLVWQLGLVWGLCAFLGPSFLGTPAETTLGLDIHRQAFEYSRWPRAAAESLILLLLVAAVLSLTAAGRNWRRSRP